MPLAAARCLLLCVVETPADLSMVEQTLSYSGTYFVLMGRLCAARRRRRARHRPRPAACAGDRRRGAGSDPRTNFTNEGEATAHYIAEMLRAHNVKVKPHRAWVPLGGELEYVDAGTISQALLDRRNI